MLGEHNAEILEELGVDADERARLAARHVIGDTPVG
jgi:crotonobetainyl-CoA:carnitine CoA-transferase CaiB-like acyl-CoA transferase